MGTEEYLDTAAAHWGLNYPKSEDIEAAIDAYAALGVKVMITELDVDVFL